MSKLRSAIAMEESASALSRKLSEWLAETTPADIWQSCATCYHMKDGKEATFCKKFQRVPPVAIVVGTVACEAYSDHYDIPF